MPKQNLTSKSATVNPRAKQSRSAGKSADNASQSIRENAAVHTSAVRADSSQSLAEREAWEQGMRLQNTTSIEEQRRILQSWSLALRTRSDEGFDQVPAETLSIIANATAAVLEPDSRRSKKNIRETFERDLKLFRQAAEFLGQVGDPGIAALQRLAEESRHLATRTLAVDELFRIDSAGLPIERKGALLVSLVNHYLQEAHPEAAELARRFLARHLTRPLESEVTRSLNRRADRKQPRNALKLLAARRAFILSEAHDRADVMSLLHARSDAARITKNLVRSFQRGGHRPDFYEAFENCHRASKDPLIVGAAERVIRKRDRIGELTRRFGRNKGVRTLSRIAQLQTATRIVASSDLSSRESLLERVLQSGLSRAEILAAQELGMDHFHARNAVNQVLGLELLAREASERRDRNRPQKGDDNMMKRRPATEVVEIARELAESSGHYTSRLLATRLERP